MPKSAAERQREYRARRPENNDQRLSAVNYFSRRRQLFFPIIPCLCSMIGLP